MLIVVIKDCYILLYKEGYFFEYVEMNNFKFRLIENFILENGEVMWLILIGKCVIIECCCFENNILKNR